MVEPINPMTEPDSSSLGGGDHITDDDQFAAMMFARNDSGVDRRVSQVVPKKEHRVSTV